MKGSGRSLELNCLFLCVVTFLVVLQVYLQRTQQRLQLNERAVDSEVGGETADIFADTLDSSSNNNAAVNNVVMAAPMVPNIRKSFPKRKAPYVRKGKNKKRKNKYVKEEENRRDGRRLWDGKKGGGKGLSDKRSVGNIENSVSYKLRKARLGNINENGKNKRKIVK